MSQRGHYPGEENQAVEWLFAVRDGIRDTFRAMLDAGRRASREAEEEAWERFDAKTKYRRKHKDS